MEWIQDGVMTDCKHLFCRTCLNFARMTDDATVLDPCPLCRTETSIQDMPPTIKHFIETAKLPCRYCKRVEFAKHMEIHITDHCAEYVVPCTYCGLYLKRKDQNEHKNYCQNVMSSPCQNCSISMPNGIKGSHNCIELQKKVVQALISNGVAPTPDNNFRIEIEGIVYQIELQRDSVINVDEVD